MMDCRTAGTLIDGLVDGDIPPGTESALHEHAVRCPACAAEIRTAFQLQARLAALPDRVLPTRDLWPEISARIATSRRSAWPRLTAVAAGSAGVMLAALLAVQHGEPAPVAPPTSTYGGDIVVAVDPGMQLAAQSMLDVAELDGDTLSPETIAIVRMNLDLIDQALREIAVALEMDPDNPQLQRQLLDTYRGQASLLDHIGHATMQTATRTDL